VVLRYVARDGAAMAAITRGLAAEGLRPRLLRSFERACLDATADPEILLRDALGPKKLKELRRLRNRLAEHGEVTFTVARDSDAVARGFDVFLALEASGWKAKRGTALAQRADEAPRLRGAAIDLAARGQCEVVMLHAGATPVAAGIVLRHLDRAFFFKLGIDEAFSKFSPGVQLTLDLTRHLCADPAITLADSTAAPGHPMIDPIWRGRLPIADVLIPLHRRDPLLPLIHAALRTHAALRMMALRLLRRKYAN
jgi:CelD/BcsL family acetyltransferase involved in cellulose biosynthesis